MEAPSGKTEPLTQWDYNQSFITGKNFLELTG